MSTGELVALGVLYEQDETAWLEAMSALILSGRCNELDFPNLAEYLVEMAKRDRREVFSRLVVLLAHLLKWDHQPDQQPGSWRGTILEQQRELRQLLESGTLLNHAVAVFADAYSEARKQAAAETDLARIAFPEEAEWDLEDALADRSDES